MKKKLLFSSISTIVLLASGIAVADEADPINIPSLDYLHAQGIKMPESDQVYPESAYTITKVENESSPYSFELITKNEAGDFITERYLINFKNTDRITWSPDGDRTLTLNLPNAEVLTEYKYTYTMPSGYEEAEGSVSGLTPDTAANLVNNKVFKDIPKGISNTTDLSTVNIKSDFIGSMITSTTAGMGSAIYNSGINAKIGGITGSFVGNHINISNSGSGSFARGGAIYNIYGTIDSINGDFISNYVQENGSSLGLISEGGAIYNGTNATINNIVSNFIGNYAEETGAVSTSSNAGAHGGAIYNMSNATIGNIAGDFIGNFVTSTSSNAVGGAIYNKGSIGHITGDFIGNYAESSNGNAEGGAIYNGDGGNISIANSNFINNYVSGATAQGGAIWSSADITIGADQGTSEFIGNYVMADGVKTENAIWMNNPTTTLTLNSINNGSIIFNDEIDGAEGYKIAMTGDSGSRIEINNDIRHANISLEGTNANVGEASYLNNNDSLTINSGNLNLAHLGSNETLALNSLDLKGGALNVEKLDIDLSSKKSGQITAATATVENGVINVESINLTSLGKEAEMKVQFAGEGLESAVKSSVSEAESPVYVYRVRYDNESGEFVFTRPNGDSYKNFNAAIFGGEVMAMSGLNMQSGVVNQISDASDSGLSGGLDYSKARVWATPYMSDDTIEYDNFYDVDSKNYGIIAGVDSKAFRYANGMSAVYTAFGAYNSGEDKYEGVKVDNDSWLLGLKASVYKDNFYGDAIVNYAWHDGKSKTSYGTDSIDATGYGVALKGGYKYNDRHNRWKADTSMMLSWQRVESDDYTTKAGVKIKSDDFSRLTLTPQVKVGYRALKYWTPYGLVRYNFVLSEEGGSRVEDIDLPELESKGYVEYGLGVEMVNLGNHSGYAHVLRHDGGRSGWSTTAGYRYNF